MVFIFRFDCSAYIRLITYRSCKSLLQGPTFGSLSELEEGAAQFLIGDVIQKERPVASFVSRGRLYLDDFGPAIRHELTALQVRSQIGKISEPSAPLNARGGFECWSCLPFAAMIRLIVPISALDTLAATKPAMITGSFAAENCGA